MTSGVHRLRRGLVRGFGGFIVVKKGRTYWKRRRNDKRGSPATAGYGLGFSPKTERGQKQRAEFTGYGGDSYADLRTSSWSRKGGRIRC